MNLSQMDPITRQNNIDHLNQRWRQLYELDKEWGEKAFKYLFLTNSGGAIATLSFLGAAKDLSYLPCLKLALVAFVLGVVLVGASIARTYHNISSLFKHYRNDANNFIKDSVSWEFLIAEDENRAKPSVWMYIFPYLSFICFIVGSITGGYSLFGH